MSNKNLIKTHIIIYRTQKGPELKVKLQRETLWLTLNQIAYLFDVQKAAISKHINNIYNSGELSKNSTVSKTETVQTEGNRKIKRTLTYFNLDVIISIGYRVNSKRATQFRIWATKVLKNYLVQGYAIHQKRLLEQSQRLKELTETIKFIKNKSSLPELSGQAEELLYIIQQYANSFTLLYQYDENTVSLYKTKKPKSILRYEECKNLIEKLKEKLSEKKEASNLFGSEVNHKFKAITGAIYQTFDKKELYSTIEEKAVNLFYLITKDHPFVDGNKRIASFLFIYFLEKNSYLFKINGERKISDTTLVALSLLIATSQPKDKEIMIKIISNLLKG